MLNKIAKFSKEYFKTFFSIPQEKKYKIVFIKPNYKIVDKLTNNSIVVDLGTGEDADFSVALIGKYGVKAFGFDPTKKHHSNLNRVVERTGGRFQYYKFAISNRKGVKTFLESIENRSGTFFKDHINASHDKILSYSVETIPIGSIFDLLSINEIDLLKMDIEGEEYRVLDSISRFVLDVIDQLIVEFHHETINRFNFRHTQKIVKTLENAGFRSHTTDYVNYLFFRAK